VSSVLFLAILLAWYAAPTQTALPGRKARLQRV